MAEDSEYVVLSGRIDIVCDRTRETDNKVNILETRQKGHEDLCEAHNEAFSDKLKLLLLSQDRTNNLMWIIGGTIIALLIGVLVERWS